MPLTKLITDLIDGDLGGGGISWVTDDKTADFTATAGEGYFVNTTSAAITVTLPSSPSAGDEVSIVDYAGTADTNNITITSSDNINGSSNDVSIDYERGGVSMVYVDATQGWIAYNAANETATALDLSLEPLTVDYLVVAGGGGGGGVGGGGGAGGYRTSFEDSNTPALSLAISTNYAVTIGNGGAPSATGASWNYDNGIGENGGNSVFSTITSAGGGGGAGGSNAAGSGGSGGGSRSGTAGSGNTPSVTPSQGNNGAQASGTIGGGGGGASQAGNTTANNGGNGSDNSITGSAVTYAGGGGGGGSMGANIGSGGTGGGASGGANAGTVNTGGGGGGGSWTNNNNLTTQRGGAGGSGVVILRYPDAYTITETTSGGNVLSFTTDDSTVADTKITTFTVGDGTIEFTVA